ncbi:hypothetical protein HMPREF9075_01973 [Capnocytophaga sp. oral taxon 332 str. F0381]|nr:hypothetical protein HMPREF9075_01973 [Capnocytophaga sp. oral taxon 332 str. F0381]
MNWAQAASLRQQDITAEKQEMFSRDNKQRHKNIEDIEDE